MNIVYFGNNPRGVKCLTVLHAAGFNVAAVVVHHGASDKPEPASVHYLAKQYGLPVFDPKNVNSSEFLIELKKIKPDLMVLSGYNQILKREILAFPPKGTINLHGGYLPKYRGGSPINWQIINGETVGACAIIYVDEGIDTGDILAQETYPIGLDDTAGEITEKTLNIFPRLLIEVVNQIKSGAVKPIKQDLALGSYYCKRYPDDGRIVWDKMTAQDVHNLVRGLNGPSLQGAFTFLRDQEIIIWRTKLCSLSIKGIPGRIALKNEEGVIVLTKDSGVLITEIKLGDDPRILSARDYFKICGWTFV